jgi:hypothetical protein
VTDELEEKLSHAMGSSTASGRLSIKQYERKNRGVAKATVLPHAAGTGGKRAGGEAEGAAVKKPRR